MNGGAGLAGCRTHLATMVDVRAPRIDLKQFRVTHASPVLLRGRWTKSQSHSPAKFTSCRATAKLAIEYTASSLLSRPHPLRYLLEGVDLTDCRYHAPPLRISHRAATVSA